MPTKPFYVLDANVIVSAVLLPRSISRQAFDAAISQGRIGILAPGQFLALKKA